MIPGTRLDFIVRLKGRYEIYTPYDNQFELKVEGASEMRVNGSPVAAPENMRCHTFMDDDDSKKYTDWQYTSVTITAETGGSGLQEITRRGVVDLIPVDIDDNVFATGVAPSGNDPNGFSERGVRKCEGTLRPEATDGARVMKSSARDTKRLLKTGIPDEEDEARHVPMKGVI